MKRVALIRNSYSYDIGGAEIFPINLGQLLASSNYKPFVLSANKKTLKMASKVGLATIRSPWWSFQNFSGIRLLLLPVYLLWITALGLWYLVFFLSKRIDIIHPQSRDDFIASTIAGKLLRKQVIWTDHADLKYIYMNHSKWYKNPVGKLVYLVSKFADKIMIESFSEKSLIESSLNMKLPNNYTVIHLGVVDHYKSVKRTGKNIVLVSTSRLVKAKGIGELIKAFKEINNKNITLKICGDGPDANYFKSLSKGVPNIEFTGHTDDVISVLLHSDILIHPSYHEGFGLSLVEAEMCGLPIIASRVGSIPEIVKDGISGILVDVKDVGGLKTAINLLSSNRTLMNNMGESGRKIFLENFQFDKIVQDKIIPIYES